MANNPYVNKVEYAGQTIMDLTEDTVSPSDVLNGVSFHDRSGAPQTGSLITHDVYDGLDSSSASDALSAKQGKVLNDKLASQSVNNIFTADSTNVSWHFTRYVTQMGKLVVFFTGVAVTSALQNDFLKIGTIASGYRPIIQERFVCAGQNSGKCNFGYVGTDGDIYIYNPAIDTYWFQATWLTP